MKTEIMIAVLALLSIGSLAAVFVLWAKLNEHKKLTQEEREKRWDEISRSAGLENEIERIEEWKAKAKADYMLAKSETRNEHRRYLELQDKYSAVICPTNNHVWQNGVCVKYGRVQDD